MRYRNKCETCIVEDGCWSGPETKCHSGCKLRQMTKPIYVWDSDIVELNLYPNLAWVMENRLRQHKYIHMFPRIKMKAIFFETNLKLKVKSILDGSYGGKNKRIVNWVNGNKLASKYYVSKKTNILPEHL